MARVYRRLVLLVGGQILLQIGGPLLGPFVRTTVGSVILLLLVLGLGLWTAVTAYQLAQQLQEGIPLLWAVAMFLPCINVLVLLVLSSKAQTWCHRYGIKVGLFGPTEESLEEFRQRLLSAHFD